jgi:hypothetical protein
MWKSGKPEVHESPGDTPTAYIQLQVFTRRFLCVSTAPFGRPVVPDVYMTSAGASSSTTIPGSAGGRSARARS